MVALMMSKKMIKELRITCNKCGKLCHSITLMQSIPALENKVEPYVCYCKECVCYNA